jgi:hypothetical protein
MHESTNNNGKVMVNFAIKNEMSIASTIYQHKNIHKGTRVSPDGQTINQIDHVLINRKERSVIQDVRSLRRPDCESDHYLVKIVMQQKLLINWTKKDNQFQRWNLHNLRNKEKIFKYRKAVGDNLEQVPVAEEIEEWQNIKNIIFDAANDNIGHETRKPRNAWWDGECELMAREKNKARVRWKTRSTRANSEAVLQKIKEAKALYRKKRCWLERKAEEIEEANRINDCRKFYIVIKRY